MTAELSLELAEATLYADDGAAEIDVYKIQERVRMDDPQAPPVGTKGTVLGVDDIGSIIVAWDNGCGLSVAFGEDLCRKVEGTSDGAKRL